MSISNIVSEVSKQPRNFTSGANVNATANFSEQKMILWYWSVRAAIAFLTTIGNGLVIFLILKSRRLRVIPNVFIFALALADLLVGAIITPTEVSCTYWLPKTCDPQLLQLTFDILIHLSVTNLGALTFDRYMAVVKPLKYHIVMTKGKVAIILAITWLAATIFPITGYICLLEQLTLPIKVLRVIDTVLLQFIPPILLAAAYLRMLYIARQHEKTVRTQQTQLNYNYGGSLIAKKKRRKTRESRERASVKMIGAVIIAFLLCYVLAIFRSLYFYIMNGTIPDTVTRVSRILLLTNSAVNVLVYAILKRDFREELQRIFGKPGVIKESIAFQDVMTKDSLMLSQI